MARQDRLQVRETDASYGRTSATARDSIANKRWNGGSVTPNYQQRRITSPKTGTDLYEQGPLESVEYSQNLFFDQEDVLNIFPTFGSRWMSGRPDDGQSLRYSSEVSQNVSVRVTAGNTFCSVTITGFSDGDISVTT